MLVVFGFCFCFVCGYSLWLFGVAYLLVGVFAFLICSGLWCFGWCVSLVYLGCFGGFCLGLWWVLMLLWLIVLSSCYL